MKQAGLDVQMTLQVVTTDDGRHSYAGIWVRKQLELEAATSPCPRGTTIGNSPPLWTEAGRPLTVTNVGSASTLIRSLA
jgi:hypothetical protein